MCMIIEGSGFTTILTDIETQEMCNYGIKTATILTITHIHISRDSMIKLIGKLRMEEFYLISAFIRNTSHLTF